MATEGSEPTDLTRRFSWQRCAARGRRKRQHLAPPGPGSRCTPPWGGGYTWGLSRSPVPSAGRSQAEPLTRKEKSLIIREAKKRGWNRGMDVHSNQASQRLMSPQDVAEILGLSPKAVRDLCARRQIPARKVGNRWYIPAAYIEELCDHRRGDASAARRKR